MRQWVETSICVDQFCNPSIPIELWHLDWPRGRDALKCRHIHIVQTAQLHFCSRLPISHRSIKGIHDVATGNSHDQLAFDLSCAHTKHGAPGSDYTSNVIFMPWWMDSPSPSTHRAWPLLFQMERVKSFLSEGVWRAEEAKSPTFPSLPIAKLEKSIRVQQFRVSKTFFTGIKTSNHVGFHFKYVHHSIHRLYK